jgi:hypothetical protein
VSGRARLRQPWALLAALALAPACTGTGGEPPSGPAGGTEAVADAPLWSRAGVEAQPRMAVFRRRAAETMPEFTPGTTSWRARPVPAADAAGAAGPALRDTPGALLHGVAAALEWPAALGVEVWEQSYRVWLEGADRGVGIVLRWGLKDDSLVGHDLRLQLRRGADGWRVESAEERFHCGRGVTEDGLCV